MITERRCARRYDIAAGELAVLPVSMSVRILDLSMSGVLIESSHPAKEGRRGRLAVDLGGRPVLADVEIRRVSKSLGGYHIGAMFIALTDEQHKALSAFTKR